MAIGNIHTKKIKNKLKLNDTQVPTFPPTPTFIFSCFAHSLFCSFSYASHVRFFFFSFFFFTPAQLFFFISLFLCSYFFFPFFIFSFSQAHYFVYRSRFFFFFFPLQLLLLLLLHLKHTDLSIDLVFCCYFMCS